MFPFVLGISIPVGGSLSTALLIVASFVAIFFNAQVSHKRIFKDVFKLLKDIPFLWVLPIFYGWLSITAFWAEDFEGAVKMLFSYWQIPFILPLAVGLFHLSPDASLIALFSRGLRIALWIALGIAVVQVLVLGIRPDGFAGNELVFASICAISAGLSFAMWKEDTAFFRQLAIFSFLCGVVIVAISFSRSIVITIVIQTICALIYVYRSRLSVRKQYRFLLITSILIFGTISAIAFKSSVFERLVQIRIVTPIENLLGGGVGDDSIQTRLNLLQTGFDAFTKHPILGSGIQNVVEVSNAVSLEVLGRQTQYNYTHLHNDYLTYAVGGGLPLLVLFVLVLIAPIFVAKKMSENRQDRSAVIYFSVALSFGYMATALNNIVLRHDILTTLFAASFVFVIVSILQDKQVKLDVGIPNFNDILQGKISKQEV